MSNPTVPNKSFFDCKRFRSIEYEFLHAAENAALSAIHWVGCGEKERADFAACDAIRSALDKVDICAEVISGEGIKDNAPGIFHGERLGTWTPGSPRFDIVLDPVDGTTNLARGMTNSISAIGASLILSEEHSRVLALPSFYSHKITFGHRVAQTITNSKLSVNWLDQPLEETLLDIAQMLDKPVTELVALVLDRPRNEAFIRHIRNSGAKLRTISDGDIAGAIAPALPDADVDLYVGIGGTPEGILAAAALRALGGGMQMRMWFRSEDERVALSRNVSEPECARLYREEEIVPGENVIFCATGILDSPMLPGVKWLGKAAVTHSVIMLAPSCSIRYIRTVHDLERSVVLPFREMRQLGRPTESAACNSAST
ncbi:MAG TPA: fructose-bisphosphatase class II [Verrucomicrobiae bacterium]|nr:fructose-bisphosphatase class II [Verrucomicrobiae bacterium]